VQDRGGWAQVFWSLWKAHENVLDQIPIPGTLIVRHPELTANANWREYERKRLLVDEMTIEEALKSHTQLLDIPSSL
jgi:hypothetical protein